LLHGSAASLVVGEEKRVFIVPKELLYSVSEYFKAALEGNFKEATEQKVELPDDDPEVIERVLLWAYTGKILDQGETVDDMSFMNLAGIYVFAESRCVPQLQNDIIDLIIRRSYATGIDLLDPIEDGNWYTNVSPSSLLRRLAADISADAGKLDSPDWKFQSYPKDFLIGLIQAFYRIKEEGHVEDFWKIRCDYHIHAEGEPCCPDDPSENEK